MAERRENSVLFSLRELRGIEDERVKQEEATERARIEAERKAREEEIRRAKEAEEQKRRDEEEKVRRDALERERIDKEAQVRLAEAQHRAQLEAQTRLEQARIEAEAQAAAAAKKFPVKAVVGGIVGLILVAGGTMAYLVNKHNQELAQQQASADQARKAEIAKLQQKQEEEKKALEKEMASLQGQLDKATNEADRAKIRAQIAAATEKRASNTPRPKGDDKPKANKVNTNTNDPLGGLGF